MNCSFCGRDIRGVHAERCPRGEVLQEALGEGQFSYSAAGQYVIACDNVLGDDLDGNGANIPFASIARAVAAMTRRGAGDRQFSVECVYNAGVPYDIPVVHADFSDNVTIDIRGACADIETLSTAVTWTQISPGVWSAPCAAHAGWTDGEGLLTFDAWGAGPSFHRHETYLVAATAAGSTIRGVFAFDPNGYAWTLSRMQTPAAPQSGRRNYLSRTNARLRVSGFVVDWGSEPKPIFGLESRATSGNGQCLWACRMLSTQNQYIQHAATRCYHQRALYARGASLASPICAAGAVLASNVDVGGGKITGALRCRGLEIDLSAGGGLTLIPGTTTTNAVEAARGAHVSGFGAGAYAVQGNHRSVLSAAEKAFVACAAGTSFSNDTAATGSIFELVTGAQTSGLKALVDSGGLALTGASGVKSGSAVALTLAAFSTAAKSVDSDQQTRAA